MQRLVQSETTTRSRLDADHLIGQLQARGVEQVREETAIGALLDGSGTVPGYRTLNAIGVGRQRRGLLDHRLCSSAADGFLNASAATQTALASIGHALALLTADITDVFDADFNDVAVWSALWTQRHHRACQVQHLGAFWAWLVCLNSTLALQAA